MLRSTQESVSSQSTTAFAAIILVQTEILLSRPPLGGSNIAEQFSNGYLFGAVLNRHGFQDDFHHFSQGR